MKKYIEINKVLKVYDVPKKLWETESLMKEIPNFDKSNIDSKKIYEYKEYIILKVEHKKRIGFIVYNTKKDWESGHTHLNSKSVAEIVIKNVDQRRKPKTKNLYLLKSHIRVSNDLKYIKFLEDLIETKKNKDKKVYINKKGVRK